MSTQDGVNKVEVSGDSRWINVIVS